MRTFNEPKYISFSEYQDQIGKYLNRISAVNGVISVYLMGSIKAPGLSDIDVIVIVENDFDPDLSSKLSISNFDNRLFLHGPIILPISLARSIQDIFYATNLNLLYGTKCLQEWEELNPKKQELLSVCYAIDFTESRFVQFANSDMNSLDKRVWLTRIYSTLHSLFLHKIITGVNVSDHICELKERIVLTRANWVEHRNVSDCMFFEALDASFKINKFIFDDVLRKYYGAPAIERPLRVLSEAKLIRFTNDNLIPKYSAKYFSFFGKRVGVISANQYPSYLAHLNGYKNLNPKWVVEPLVNKKLERVKKQRVRAVVYHTAWLVKHAPKSNSMRGYLGVDLISDKSMKSKVKKLLTLTLA